MRDFSCESLNGGVYVVGKNVTDSLGTALFYDINTGGASWERIDYTKKTRRNAAAALLLTLHTLALLGPSNASGTSTTLTLPFPR